MKQAGIKQSGTSVAHIPHNELECPSLRYQFGHCLGGSTINNIAAVTVDRTVPAAAANRAMLTQLPPLNSGGCVSIVTVKPKNTDAHINSGRVPSSSEFFTE
jgi:hypothetical protein